LIDDVIDCVIASSRFYEKPSTNHARQPWQPILRTLPAFSPCASRRAACSSTKPPPIAAPVALLAGCGAAPPRTSVRRGAGQGAVRRSVPQIEVSQPLQISAQLREEAVARAMLAINAPYRYGGSTLASGFDCSGLVFYVFGALVSQPMPRSTLQWARASLPVAEERLQRGDFVFFNTSGAALSLVTLQRPLPVM